MTKSNPKHTNTSRSGDLVERLRDRVIYDSRHYTPDPLLKEAADRIEALKMRVAELEDIAGDLLTRFEPWSPHDHDAAKRARAALKEIEAGEPFK